MFVLLSSNFCSGDRQCQLATSKDRITLESIMKTINGLQELPQEVELEVITFEEWEKIR